MLELTAEAGPLYEGSCFPGMSASGQRRSFASIISFMSFRYNSCMYRLFPDTDPGFEELQIDLLRQAAPWKKLEMVWEMNDAVRTMLLSGLRSRHPDETPEAIERRLADLVLGADLALRVYGPRAD